jgi:hypothetical protein
VFLTQPIFFSQKRIKIKNVFSKMCWISFSYLEIQLDMSTLARAGKRSHPAGAAIIVSTHFHLNKKAHFCSAGTAGKTA